MRARRTSRPSRRGVALTVDSFGISLVMLALLYIAGLRSWEAFETIRNLTFAVLGLAPIAFLLGLLDARLARADVGDLVVHLRGDPTSATSRIWRVPCTTRPCRSRTGSPSTAPGPTRPAIRSPCRRTATIGPCG